MVFFHSSVISSAFITVAWVVCGHLLCLNCSVPGISEVGGLESAEAKSGSFVLTSVFADKIYISFVCPEILMLFVQEIMALLHQGNKNRTTEATGANASWQKFLKQSTELNLFQQNESK